MVTRGFYCIFLSISIKLGLGPKLQTVEFCLDMLENDMTGSGAET